MNILEKEKTIIDIDKLVNARRGSNCIIAQCPACNLQNEDQHGKNHFILYDSGQFGCSKYQNDKPHRALILKCVGVGSDGVIDYIPQVQKEPTIEVPKEWPLELTNSLIKDYSYWTARGVSEEVCRKFNIGVAIRGQMNKRIVIPIYSTDKRKIIGFTGRKLEKESDRVKWKHLNPSSEFIWPYQPEAIKKSKKIILVEGPGDVLTLESYGILNSLCLFGVNISSKAMGYIIRENPEEILIATNNEPKNKNIGFFAAQKIQKKLLQFFNSDKIKIALPEAKDFNDCTLEQIEKYKREYNL